MKLQLSLAVVTVSTMAITATASAAMPAPAKITRLKYTCQSEDDRQRAPGEERAGVTWPSEWSDDGRLLAATSGDAVCIVDANTEDLVRMSGYQSGLWEPGSHKFLLAPPETWGSDTPAQLAVYDAEAASLVAQREKRPDEDVLSFHYAPDRSSVLLIYRPGQLRLLDPRTLADVTGDKIPPESCGVLSSATWQPGTKILLTVHRCKVGDAGYQPRLRTIDTESGTILDTLDAAFTYSRDPPNEPAWSPNGSMYAFKAPDGPLMIRTVSGQTLMTMNCAGCSIQTWNAGGTLLAVHSYSHTDIIDAATFQLVRKVEGSVFASNVPQWLDEKTLLGVPDPDGRVGALNVLDGSVTQLFTVASKELAWELSPDKQHLVVRQPTRAGLRVVRIDDGATVFEDPAAQPSLSVYWSPDSRKLAYELEEDFVIATLR